MPLIFDDDRKQLLCRPRGGFNDVLVQIEICRRYAEIHDRHLLIDTRRSFLGHSLDLVFQIGPDFGVDTLFPAAGDLHILDHIQDVRPAELAGRVSSYEVVRDQSAGLYLDESSRTPVLFDVSRAHEEKLLVYEQSGGGCVGLHTLKRLELNSQASQAIAKRLSHLPLDYDAVHVRHSDYKTDYKRLLERCRPLFRNRSLVVCTDNSKVQKLAEETFVSSTEVRFTTEIPETADTPLFATDYQSRYALTLDLLTDLFALGQSRRFVFTELSGGFHGKARWSGYSLLAYLIRREPEVVASLFEYLPALQENQKFRERLENRLRRPAPGLWELRTAAWNFKTLKKARRWYKRYRENLTSPLAISPVSKGPI